MTDNDMITKLDDRLRNIMLQPTQSGDRAALVAVLKTVNATRPDRRERTWQHFEATIAHGLGSIVRDMHSIYETIAIELANRPSSKAYDDVQQRIAAARRREALTVDQE